MDFLGCLLAKLSPTIEECTEFVIWDVVQRDEMLVDEETLAWAALPVSMSTSCEFLR